MIDHIDISEEPKEVLLLEEYRPLVVEVVVPGPQGSTGLQGTPGVPGDSVIADPGDSLTLAFENGLI